MRIVSLLPSLSELVAALGHAEDLVGITHECDYPETLSRLPRLTRSLIPTEAPGHEIDAQVAAQPGSLYALDVEQFAALQPDLVLTQSQCDVCAVNEDYVRGAAARLPDAPHVESVNPTDLAGVFAMFRRVGDLLGPTARKRAESLVAGFESTTAEIARRRGGDTPVLVAHLEWIDPPYVAGHWIPEIIVRAGGRDVVGRAGRPSIRTTWAELTRGHPDLILAAPCGFSIDRAAVEMHALSSRPECPDLLAGRHRPRIALADGNAHFSRPGPRLEESIRVAAAAISPEKCGDLAPPSTWREWRSPA